MRAVLSANFKFSGTSKTLHAARRKELETTQCRIELIHTIHEMEPLTGEANQKEKGNHTGCPIPINALKDESR
jgi:hypothetical protein